MKSLIRCVVIGGVAVTVLTVTFVVLLLNPVQTIPGGIAFASGQATDVQSVSVTNESGSFQFFFDFEEDGFVIDDIPPYLVDLDAFVAFMTNSAQLSALHAMPKSDVDLQDADLLEPLARVLIEFFDGTSLELTIGGRERISNNYYALVNDSDNVYILSASLARQFLMPKTQVVTRIVTPPLALSSPLSAIRDITFTGESLERSITIVSTTDAEPDVLLEAISFGAPTHIVRGMSNYQLDQTYGAQVFGSLFGITGEIVAYDLSDAEFSAFGFDNPYMVVTYSMVNGAEADLRQMRIKIAQAGDGRFYITHDDICAIYLIDRLPFIDIQFERLPARRFLTPLLMDLSAVTIEAPGREHRFEIDNTDLRNPIITYGEMELGVDLFRSFFRLITSAAHDGTYLGALAPPQGDALLRIIYEYAAQGKESDILALYPGVERRVNVYINGAGEFAMREMFVQRVLEGSENLISGRSIEENW